MPLRVLRRAGLSCEHRPDGAHEADGQDVLGHRYPLARGDRLLGLVVAPLLVEGFGEDGEHRRAVARLARSLELGLALAQDRLRGRRIIEEQLDEPVNDRRAAVLDG